MDGLPGPQLSSGSMRRWFDPRGEAIADFWNELRVCDELDPTFWEVLEPLERKVADCLSCDPPDFDLASKITAQAMFMLSDDDAI